MSFPERVLNRPISKRHTRGSKLLTKGHVISSNTDLAASIVEQMEEVLREPLPTWIPEIHDELTTKDNYEFRYKRAVAILRYLHSEPDAILAGKLDKDLLYDVKLLRYLSSSKHCEDPELFAKSQAMIIKEKLPELIMSYSQPKNHLGVRSLHEWKGNAPKHELFYHMLMALWFISSSDNHRKDLCERMCEWYMTVLIEGSFDTAVNQKKGKRQSDCVKAILGTLYQFSSALPMGRAIIRRMGGIERLSAFHSSNYKRNVKARALLVLVYLLSEKDQQQLQTTSGSIKFLRGLLEECCEHSNHKSKLFNYNVLEIIGGMNRLAVNDENKMALVEEGVLRYYAQLVTEGSLQEREEACKGLWTLSFNKEIAMEIMDNDALMNALREMKTSEHESLRTAAAGCMWTLSESQKVPSVEPKVTQGKHIMISYNWSIQPLAIKVKDFLLQHGYRVWLDIENMSGSTLSAMSNAVENSAVVLILFNEKYKFSPACRAEAEYAYKLKKDFIAVRVEKDYIPDGWLGMLLGIKMHHDLCDETNYEQILTDIINEIGERGKGAPIDPRSSANANSSDKIHRQITMTEVKAPFVLPDTLSWTQETVFQWVRDNKIQIVAERLGGDISGELLIEMRDLLLQQPKLFYEMTKELNLDMIGKLSLSRALRTLQ